MSDIVEKQELGTLSPEQEEQVQDEQIGDEQAGKEPVERILKVDLSQIRTSNLNESSSQHQKTDFLEELNNREDEIRRMLYESQPGTDRASNASKANKKGIATDVVRHIKNEDDEECTFKPKLNAKTKKLITEKRQGTDQPVNETLYKVALDKKSRTKEQEAELKQNLSKVANSNKISANSMKIILKKIEASLRNLINDVENPNAKGKINFENLGVILNRLGVFQNLEFIPQQNDENANKSSLSVNQSKVKPQRLAREIAFHENFWRILDATSNDEDLVPSETVFRFLMVLVEDKAAVQESANFLEEIVEVALEEQGQTAKEGESSPYQQLKNEKDLWEMEKLVTEFRKLFNDKTTFMNIYSTVGVLPNKGTLEERPPQEAFRPTINPKSKEIINKKSAGTYEDKVKAVVQEHVSPTKLQTRHDVLHEHHKYIKSKKHENLEMKLEQEMANCTFKPTITEYKKPNKDKTQIDPNGSINLSQLRYSQILNSDLSKAKRHDLLYEVARVQKEKLQQKAYEVKKLEEEEELSKCTFKPKITPLSEESPTKLQTMQGGIPKGYKKAIERLQVAERLREERKAEREYIPRGENYDKVRNSEFRPPSFLSRPKTKKQEALVYVDVNIGPGKTGRIGIHKGDNAKVLARNFAKTYSLPPIMKDSLEKLLQSYIDSYFPETEQSPDEREDELHNQQVNYQVDFNEEQVEGEEEEEEEDVERGAQERERMNEEENEEEEEEEENEGGEEEEEENEEERP